MKLYLRLLAVLLAVFVASPSIARAQTPEGITWVPLAQGYNPSSVSFIYCAASPADSPWHHGVGRIVTSGSSTTVTALSTSTTAPFQQIFNGTAANYIIRYNLSGVRTYSKVSSAASATSITVAAAVDLGTTGITFDWAQVNSCGTTATSGWFYTYGATKVEVSWQIDTLGSTSIDFKMQCKHEGPLASPIDVVASTNYTTVTAADFSITKQYDQCRVGMKVNTDGADSVSTDVYLIHSK
jgi:hypothetical protein